MVSCGVPSTTTTSQLPPSEFSTIIVLNTPEVKITEPHNNIEILPSVIPDNKSRNTSYLLDVYYDNETNLLSAVEAIIYSNQTMYALESIPLVIPETVNISSVNVNGKIIQSMPATVKNSIVISLDEKLLKGEIIELNITYTMRIPKTQGALGWTENQINFTDFYPVIPPFKDGEGWLINMPGNVGEHMAYELSDFNLIFSTNLTVDFELFGNAHSEKNQDKYLINASNYRNLVLSVCTACVRSEYDYGNFKVLGSFVPEDKSKGDEAMAIIGQSILYFSDLFGVAYPHDEITIVESNFPDGMEYDGLFFLSKDYFDQYIEGFQNYFSILNIHETAHQWWYGIVGNDQANEPWLDEALSTYSELLFLEEFFPDLTTWWWDYRVFSYRPEGFVSSTIDEFDNDRSYINAIYLRGALYLNDLRSNLSNELFMSRLKDYAHKFNGKISDSNGFESVFLVDMTPEIVYIKENYFGN